MIQLKKVNKSFGEIQALNNIDLVISKGELHGLVGPTELAKPLQ